MTALSDQIRAARPPIVVLCGSTRFRDQFTETNRQLTLAGAIVLAPAVFGHAGDPMTDAEKARLDALHLAKIDLADEVRIVSLDGYIGKSTRREITYARAHGTPVRCPDCRCRPGACESPDDDACDGCASCVYGCPLEDCPVCTLPDGGTGDAR